ncbi:hypothetical protein O3G_MSEX009738 [Manduca sexta]|uniref:Uncharacterized protein n=1 Tax=Manduca sexta TaxID=7130 RepID=A0A921ZFB6_MANSE|nr:hypothetical protein O3G_MSEX009738 [Manduca sexta]
MVAPPPVALRLGPAIALIGNLTVTPEQEPVLKRSQISLTKPVPARIENQHLGHLSVTLAHPLALETSGRQSHLAKVQKEKQHPAHLAIDLPLQRDRGNLVLQSRPVKVLRENRPTVLLVTDQVIPAIRASRHRSGLVLTESLTTSQGILHDQAQAQIVNQDTKRLLIVAQLLVMFREPRLLLDRIHLRTHIRDLGLVLNANQDIKHLLTNVQLLVMFRELRLLLDRIHLRTHIRDLGLVLNVSQRNQIASTNLHVQKA